MYGIQKGGTNELIHSTRIETQMQRMDMWTQGEGEGERMAEQG